MAEVNAVQKIQNTVGMGKGVQKADYSQLEQQLGVKLNEISGDRRGLKMEVYQGEKKIGQFYSKDNIRGWAEGEVKEKVIDTLMNQKSVSPLDIVWQPGTKEMAAAFGVSFGNGKYGVNGNGRHMTLAKTDPRMDVGIDDGTPLKTVIFSKGVGNTLVLQGINVKDETSVVKISEGGKKVQ